MSLQGPPALVTSDNTHLSLPILPELGLGQQACNQLHGGLSADGVVGQYLDACWAEATKRAYAGDVRDFLAWGGEIPASVESVARYAAERASQLSAATLARRLIGIGGAHVVAGFRDPTKDHLIGMVLKGIRRTHGVAQRRAQPIDPREWRRAWLASEGLRGKRDKALVMLGFSAALRRSELIGLDFEDLSWSNRGLSVRLRKSKTDQEGASRVVAVPWAGEANCAAQSTKEWMAASGVKQGALFRSIDRHGRLRGRLHPQSVNLIVKALAQQEGLSAELTSGHSLRAGFVTEAAKAGADLASIQRQTGHMSLDMLARYIRDTDPFSGNANSKLGLASEQLRSQGC